MLLPARIGDKLAPIQVDDQSPDEARAEVATRMSFWKDFRFACPEMETNFRDWCSSLMTIQSFVIKCLTLDFVCICVFIWAIRWGAATALMMLILPAVSTACIALVIFLRHNQHSGSRVRATYYMPAILCILCLLGLGTQVCGAHQMCCSHCAVIDAPRGILDVSTDLS